MKRLAILLLLLAATTQAFVAQTHVHGSLSAQATVGTQVADGPAAPVGDESNCLLCQIAAHGAAALASHQSSLPQVAQQYTIATALVSTDPVSLPPTHAWLSRGPPRS